jgi:hypothetical protein
MYNSSQNDGRPVWLRKGTPMLKTIDVQEAQVRPRELLSQELRGEEFVLTEDNKPVARVIRITKIVSTDC